MADGSFFLFPIFPAKNRQERLRILHMVGRNARYIAGRRQKNILCLFFRSIGMDGESFLPSLQEDGDLLFFLTYPWLSSLYD